MSTAHKERHRCEAPYAESQHFVHRHEQHEQHEQQQQQQQKQQHEQQQLQQLQHQLMIPQHHIHQHHAGVGADGHGGRAGRAPDGAHQRVGRGQDPEMGIACIGDARAYAMAPRHPDRAPGCPPMLRVLGLLICISCCMLIGAACAIAWFVPISSMVDGGRGRWSASDGRAGSPLGQRTRRAPSMLGAGEGQLRERLDLALPPRSPLGRSAPLRSSPMGLDELLNRLKVLAPRRAAGKEGKEGKEGSEGSLDWLRAQRTFPDWFVVPLAEDVDDAKWIGEDRLLALNERVVLRDLVVATTHLVRATETLYLDPERPPVSLQRQQPQQPQGSRTNSSPSDTAPPLVGDREHPSSGLSFDPIIA